MTSLYQAESAGNDSVEDDAEQESNEQQALQTPLAGPVTPRSELSTPRVRPTTPQSIESFVFTDGHTLDCADTNGAPPKVYRVSHGAVDIFKVRRAKEGRWKTSRRINTASESSVAASANAASRCIGTTSEEQMGAILSSFETDTEVRQNRFCRDRLENRFEQRETSALMSRSGNRDVEADFQEPVGKGAAYAWPRERSRWDRVRDLWCFARPISRT